MNSETAKRLNAKVVKSMRVKKNYKAGDLFKSKRKPSKKIAEISLI